MEDAAPNVIWQPLPGSQTLFLNCPHFEVLFEGTRGPGKTDALLMDFLQDVGAGFGAAWRGILFRETYPQLKDIIAKSKKWIHQIFPGAKYNKQDHAWTFPDGEELIFSHIRTPDDYWNYHGHEYPWIGFEELTSWATRDCYEAMKSCCRSSFKGCVDKRTGKYRDMPRKYRATTNPFGVGHNWVKARFIDPAPSGTPIGGDSERIRMSIFGNILENPYILENDPDYVKNIMALTDNAKREAWLEGSWDIISGGMFDDIWDQRAHVLEPFKIPPSWYCDRSFDWGSSKPFSAGWWAESDGTDATLKDGTTRSTTRGDIFRFAEWYGARSDSSGTVVPNEGVKMLAKDVALGIKEREEIMRLSSPGMEIHPGPADSSIYDNVNGNSIASDMSNNGIDWTKANKAPGTRVLGWEKMRGVLEGANDSDEPGLYIFNTCRQFIRTVPVIQRDKRNADDVDTNAEDHIADEVRYRLYDKRAYAGTLNLSGY